MSELGPLPEQPIFHPRIPTVDLREAIRMDHGIYDEEEDAYSEHPLLPTFPVRPAIPKEKESSEWDVTGIGTAFALCAVLVVAWAIHPALVVGVALLCLILTPIFKRLH